MSVSLSNVDQTIFDEQVKKAYQSKGFILRDAVRLRANVQGTTLSFRKVGTVTAEQYAFQTAVIYQDPGFNKVDVVLHAYRAPTLIDDLQQFLFNFDERKEDAELVAMALGRRSDQLILDALAASGTANLIAADATGFTYAKVRQINQFFSSLAVPPSERFIAISAGAEADIMASIQFTNSQYTHLNAVTDGGLNGAYVMGMNWRVIPTMTEGGLPVTGTTRSVYAWSKSAVGMGTGRDFSTIIERVPHLDSWQVLGKMFANAAVIDATGVVQVNFDEAIVENSAMTVTTI